MTLPLRTRVRMNQLVVDRGKSPGCRSRLERPLPDLLGEGVQVATQPDVRGMEQLEDDACCERDSRDAHLERRAANRGFGRRRLVSHRYGIRIPFRPREQPERAENQEVTESRNQEPFGQMDAAKVAVA